jgi:hypothetical protein
MVMHKRTKLTPIQRQEIDYKFHKQKAKVSDRAYTCKDAKNELKHFVNFYNAKTMYEEFFDMEFPDAQHSRSTMPITIIRGELI